MDVECDDHVRDTGRLVARSVSRKSHAGRINEKVGGRPLSYNRNNAPGQEMITCDYALPACK